MISVSIDRTSLSLTPLVISDDFTDSLYLAANGVVWPVFEERRDYAPDSKYAPGRMLLSAVLGSGEWPVTIYARGTSSAEVATAKAELEAAVGQRSYDFTLTVDSVAATYHAELVLSIPWGPIDSGMVAAHLARTSFSIPLNP